MESIAFEGEKGKDFSGRMRRFFSRFQIGGILRECNAYKERGIPALTVLAYLFSLAFKGRSLYLDTLLKKAPGFGKDTAYRFRNSVKINWLRFVTTLSYRVYHTAIKPLTNETREGAIPSLSGRVPNVWNCWPECTTTRGIAIRWGFGC